MLSIQHSPFPKNLMPQISFEDAVKTQELYVKYISLKIHVVLLKTGEVFRIFAMGHTSVKAERLVQRHFRSHKRLPVF